MSKDEKENRINSLALTFLERQQIRPNIFADQIIRGYKEGYRQAEKDLSDISWIKEVSGVKEMKRAEEEALKACPPRSIAANYDTIARRNAFEFGYLKAEKDLELTWEDIPKIFQISEELKTSWWFRDNEQTKLIGTQVFWEEVLKRFKAIKDG